MATGSRLRRFVKWFVGILAVLFLAFFYGVVPWFLTSIATTSRFHFPDPNDTKTPRSYGMDFHAVQFETQDGILLKGWYIPAGVPQPLGTIVYCHGHNRTRIEMLPMAAFAHGLGYNGLVFDLRHQGESGGNTSSVGYWERLDAEAAAQYALAEEHAQRPVILWGVSMGAAAALMAAAETPDVAAVISDSTFLNFKDVVLHHYHLFLSMVRRRWWWFPPLPAFPLAYEVMYGAAHRAHFKPDDFDLERAVKRINPRPILFVGVEGDQRMPPSIARTLYGVATSPLKAITLVPGSRHGEGFNESNAQYREAATGFLAKIQSPSTTADVSAPSATSSPAAKH